MQIVRDEKTTGLPNKITMRKPFDGHQHLRQGAMLKLVVPMVAKRFGSVVVMPNTTPPITTTDQIYFYVAEIFQAIHEPTDFGVFVTLYLTDTLDPLVVEDALNYGGCVGIKHYPPGLTTNSDSGVQDPSALWTKGTKPYECLRALAKNDGVLLLHAADGKAAKPWGVGIRFYSEGELLDPYDQELHFILITLPRIRDAHPDLKISVEHLSTADGARHMRDHGGEKLGCSLTAQHLLLDRRDNFRSGKRMGFNTHTFWWPIIQPLEHQQELRRFASEGHSFVWLGSDSAPHPIGKKLADCCTGGVLTAHAGIELYAGAFEDMGCLDKFEAFASINGPQFYGIAPSQSSIMLVREEWKIQETFYCNVEDDGDTFPQQVVPFRLGETVRWKLAD